jgi:leader peptidase (prepilin peptidase)/N-methyltransferase
VFSTLLKDYTALQNIRNAEVAALLVLIAWLDWKEKIIPNTTILIMIGCWICLSAVEIFAAGTAVKSVLLYSASGAAVGAILWIIALILKNALGMGDVKLIFSLGLLYGFEDTYSILLFSIILMALVSIGLIIAKKATRKSSIPMAPFILVGFIVNVVMGM